MTERITMRLREGSEVCATWEQYIDPYSGRAMHAALLAAIVGYGDGELDAARFSLEWRGRTGGWQTFRAGSK